MSIFLSGKEMYEDFVNEITLSYEDYWIAGNNPDNYDPEKFNEDRYREEKYNEELEETLNELERTEQE